MLSLSNFAQQLNKDCTLFIHVVYFLIMLKLDKPYTLLTEERY